MQDTKEKKEMRCCIRILRSDAKEYLKQFHYLETVPGGSKSFALIEGGEVRGIVCTLQHGEEIELTRFMLLDNKKNEASRWLAFFLKFLKEITVAERVITFADPNVGHTGSIYRAVGGRLVSEGRDTIGFKVGDKIFSGRNMSYALCGKESRVIPVRLKGKLKFEFLLRS